MSGVTMLEVQDLNITYASGSQRHRAVDSLSLRLDRGATLGIAGASGSGKTSVALALLGLLDRRATQLSGSIRFNGTELTTLPEAEWRDVRGLHIGAIFQSPTGTFNPTMTIGQHLEEVIRLSGANDTKARTIAALEKVGMPRARDVLRSYAFELSGGMCQRAAIALALAQEPALLIADEPTSSLDVIAQVEICRLLETLNVELGLSMIVISHDLGLIGRLADRVAVMSAGRVVEAGVTNEIFRSPKHAYTRRLLGSVIDLGRVPATQEQAA